MPSSEHSKYILEQIHIDHLCATLAVERFNSNKAAHNPSAFSNGKPDLISAKDPTIAFEVKSRIFPIQQIDKTYRTKRDHSWWTIDQAQIARYQPAIDNHDTTIYWMFLIATMRQQPHTLHAISEQDIIERELYVAPWNAHNLAASKDKKYIHIGLGKLLQNYQFNKVRLNKTTIYLPNSN